MRSASFEDLEPILWRLSEKVSRRLKASGLAGRSVTLKLKDKDFRLLTRTRSGLAPTQLAARLFDPARQLLKASCDGTAFRLIGIGAADLCDAADADKGDLADQSVVRQAHMEAAIDKIRDKFGAGRRAEGNRAAQTLALAGARRLDVQGLQLAAQGEIAVIELQVAADAILVELERDPVDRQSGRPARPRSN